MEITQKLPPSTSLASTKIYDFVVEKTAERLRYDDAKSDFLMQRGTSKIIEEAALTQSWEFASSGLALGVCQPKVFREMFDRTYSPINSEDWTQAHAAGLDIPSEQLLHHYTKQDNLWGDAFLEFSERYDQAHYRILKS
jgi:hypothetical protein